MPLPFAEALVGQLTEDGVAPVLLGLDLAKSTGVALLNSNGTFAYHTTRFDHGPHPGDMFFAFRSFLNLTQETTGKIEHVFYEKKTFHRAGTNQAEIAFGMAGNLLSWCRLNDIPVTGIPNNSIKKHIAGHGRADKKMRVEAIEQFGFKPKDHNAADALATLLVGMERMIYQPDAL